MSPYETPKYDAVSTQAFLRAEVDIRSYNAVNDMIQLFVSNMEQGDVGKALWNTAREVMLESQLEWVPVRTGRLRASGRTSMPTKIADGDYVDLMYLAPYASIVHETHPTKSHYLENPLEDSINSGVFEERLARAVLEGIGFVE